MREEASSRGLGSDVSQPVLSSSVPSSTLNMRSRRAGSDDPESASAKKPYIGRHGKSLYQHRDVSAEVPARVF